MAEEPIIVQLTDTGQIIQFPAGTSREEIDTVINRDFAPVVQRRPKLIPPDWTDDEEKTFRNWYDIWAEETGTHPDPDHPDQLYNFREAFRNDAVPEQVPGKEGEYLWPDEYKIDLKRVDPATMRVPDVSLKRLAYQMTSSALQVGVGGKLQQLRLYQLNRDIPSEVEQGAGMNLPPGIEKTQYLRDYASGYMERYGKDPSPDDLRNAIKQYEQLKRIERVGTLTNAIEALPKPLPGSSGFMEEALSGLTSFAVDMGITAGSPLMGLVGTLMTLTGTEGQRYLDMGMDPQQAMERGSLVGLMQLGPEYMGNLLELSALKGTLKPLTNRIIKSAVGKRVAGMVESWLLTGVTEGMEEYPQQVSEDVMDILFKHMDNNDREGMMAELKQKYPEIAERANYAFVLGAAGGLMLGAAGTMVRLPSIATDLNNTRKQWQFLDHNLDRLGETLTPEERESIDSAGNTIFGKAARFTEIMKEKGHSLNETVNWEMPPKIKVKEQKKAEKRVKKAIKEVEKKHGIKFTAGEEEEIRKAAEAEIKKPIKERVPTTPEEMAAQKKEILADAKAFIEAGDLMNASKEIQAAHKLGKQIEEKEPETQLSVANKDEDIKWVGWWEVPGMEPVELWNVKDDKGGYTTLTKKTIEKSGIKLPAPPEAKPVATKDKEVVGKVMLSLAERKPGEISTGLKPELLNEIAKTKSFKTWFKKSKTVDKQGNPIQFFHGTVADFKAFELGDIGFHVGTWEQANDRAIPQWMKDYVATGTLPKGKEGLNIMPVFIRAENSLRLEDLGSWDSPITLVHALSEKGLIDPVTYNRLSNMAYEGPMSNWDSIVHQVKAILKSHGYDSIVYQNKYEAAKQEQDSYIVFDPDQIKSVYNAGSFDVNTPIITLSAKGKKIHHDYVAELRREKAKEAERIANLPYAKLERQLLTLQLNTALDSVIDALNTSVKIPPRMAEKIKLQVLPEIKISDLDNAMKSIKEHIERGIDIGSAVVQGYTAIKPGYVYIALSLFDQGTMNAAVFHEYYHVAEKFLLPPKAIKILENAFPNAEERAEAFADYLKASLNNETLPKVKPEVKGAWDRIVDFLKRVRDALFSRGVKTAEDVFGKIQKGEYKPRFLKIEALEEMERQYKKRKGVDYSTEQATKDALNKLRPKSEARAALDTMQKTWLSMEDGDHIRSQYMDETPAIVDLPELVQLIKDINEGQVPRIVKEFRKRGMQGVFIPGKGVIRLRADIFKDPALAQEVLAHEIGHLVDWLPDKTLARGNILGRIASLRAYMATVLPRFKGAPGELTDADRHRFRLEAERLIKEAAGTRTKIIDEMIERELGITPQDVLNIWQSLEDARLLNPELYDFIATADTNTKKMIVKEALKGRLADELKRFVRIERVPTGRKIEVTETIPVREKDIAEKYADLINKEMQKRRLWIADEITDELKKLSRIWRPFNPAASPAYTKYRYSSSELYADAISVLFSSPSLMREHAPKFYEAFFNYMDEKPLVKKTYDDIQFRIRAGTTLADLTERTYRMFDGGNNKLEEFFNRKDAKWRDRFARDFIDVFHFIIKDVKTMNESSIPAHENPRYKLEEMVYTGSEVEELLENMMNNVIKPLEKANLQWDKEFGLLAFLERVAVERAEMANPLGWDAAKALEKIDELKNTKLSKSQWKALTTALENFRKIHEDFFINKAEELDIFDPKLIQLFRDREKYVTFNVQKYLFDRYGQAAGLKIYEQIGTFQDVVNPATATILRDISFIKAANKNRAVKTTIEFYLKPETQQTLGIKVKPAKKVWDANLRKRVYKESDNLEEKLMVFLEHGNAHGYYVDRYIAESFDNSPFASNAATDVLKFIANPFRRLYTDLNYGFWMFNMWRDYKRAVNALPGASYLNFLPTYMKAFKPGFRSVFGIPDAVASEVRRQNMLISVAEIRGLTPQDKTIERMLRMYHLRPDEWNKKMVEPFGHLFNWTSNMFRLSEYYVSSLGRGFERTTKIAGYQFLRKKFPDMPKEVIGHLVRTRAGSPDFLRVGRMHPIYNNLLLFSNAMKEGYRGDWESAKDPQNRFWYKKTKYLFMPKVLMYMASIGLFDAVKGKFKDPGDDEEKVHDYPIARIMAGVSEYDKTNYTIIPLGVTTSGKSVYLRLPHDETSRLLGGWFWKAINNRDLGYGNMATGIFEYGADQLPGWNPAFKFLAAIKTFISGRDPYDEFYDRYAVPETEFEAGGARAWKAFGKYLFGQMGVLAFYRFKNEGVEQVIGEMEEILGFPLKTPVPEWMVKVPGLPGMQNALGRFIKVSDYGIREKIQRKLKLRVRRENARAILDAKDVTYRILKGEKPDTGDLMRLSLKPDVVDRAILVALARKYGYVYLDMYESAATADEKLFILGEMLKQNGLPENVFEMSLTELARKGIVRAEKLLKNKE